MSEKWVDKFCELLRSQKTPCEVTNRVLGWPETVLIGGHTCYSKSVSYNAERHLYFQGVDPGKLNDTGNLVLICGGQAGKLRDVFLIPWNEFFKAVSAGEPVNTYKLPKEYYQYKVNLKQRDTKWTMSIQGAEGAALNVTQWRFVVSDALAELKKLSR